MSHSLNLTDAELVARLTQIEDSFVERKSKSDKGGWLKTVVAFANSVPVGLPAILFIGVSDDGQIADGVDIEKTLQTFSDVLGQHAWPPIYTVPRVLTHNARSCVAVVVPGSSERPHFAGRAFVRDGTQTKDASPQQFDALIASRSGKARRILEHIGKEITWMTKRGQIEGYASGRTIVRDCDQHHFTVEMFGGTHDVTLRTEPLSRVELSLDHKRDGRLQIIFYEDR
jgi:hypothetical protein